MRFKISPDTLMKSFDDCVALAHIQTKRFHVLNSTAAIIWQHICDGQSAEEIEKMLENRFQITAEQSAGAVQKIISVLQSEGFISPS